MRSRGFPAWMLSMVVCATLLVQTLAAGSGTVASPGAAPQGEGGRRPGLPANPAAVYNAPTTSSPIALSNDKAWVWSVNPDDDSVSVINTGTDTEVFRLHVGREPQSIALDPNNQFAYVANAASNSVTVIRVTSTSPFGAVVEEDLTTGAEPWNIVISPDGKRVYVANSAQDTLTVIKADVTFPTLPSILDNVDLRNSACNVGDTHRHLQPRGLAVNLNSTQLYVTRFLSFVKPGGTQGTDIGKEGVVCRLDINTSATPGVSGFVPVTMAPQDSGFGGAFAYPNQLQSIALRGDRAYLPNVAAAPAAPLRFNNDTHAFVSIITGLAGATPSDGGAINLHLGARVPEAGKTKLFFANPWAMAFSTQSGSGNAYVVSSGSDLLVKLSVDASGTLTFTNGVSTTRTIDLNDPNNPTTSGRDAGKNPLGIVIRDTGVPGQLKAYVMNYVSRNVSVINLSTDAVSNVINLTDLPPDGSSAEELQVGREVFFSSRGAFDRPAGTTVSTVNRLSSDGWQSCSSCHFAGLTDGNVWAFGAGPRKSVPLNGTFSPHNPDDQRILNYSAIFDEVQDFELNIRNVSGPGPLSAGPPPVLDPNHGLIISDTGDINAAPAVVNAFARANAGRPQHKLTLPGSLSAWPALDALAAWLRFGVRTPNGMLTSSELTAGGGDATGGLNPTDVALGRRRFFQAGCQSCHGGTKWTVSSKDFTSPPASTEIAIENPPITTTVNTQYLSRFLVDIDSFNLNVAGGGRQIPGTPRIGAVEKAADGKDALGRDGNGDGKGNGFNIPSLLGIWQLPPYYHHGACETLDCVLADANHRTANGTRPDRLSSPADRGRVVAFLQALDADTAFPTNLRIDRHDIFFDPPIVFRNTTVIVGANASLFGTRADLNEISNTLKIRFIGPNLNTEVPLSAFRQDFGQTTVTTTWNVPDQIGVASIRVQVDSSDVLVEANEVDNSSSRRVSVRTPPPDTTPPVVNKTRISDDYPFNEDDPLVTTQDVQVRIVAADPSSPPNTSGLASYCIVKYFYDTAQRRWVESTCDFTPLPAPDESSGDTFTYTVDATIPPLEGVAYAFAWVKDNAGNISRTPGFDVVSFIPSTPININRNDVRLFRIPLAAGQVVTFTFTPDFGDVDVSVFDDFTNPNAARIAISANNGALPESVTISGPGRRQIEVRAVVNSRFTIGLESGVALGATDGSASAASAELPGTPLVAGPPALQTAIGESGISISYLPLVLR